MFKYYGWVTFFDFYIVYIIIYGIAIKFTCWQHNDYIRFEDNAITLWYDKKQIEMCVHFGCFRFNLKFIELAKLSIFNRLSISDSCIAIIDYGLIP